jgi:arylsulfatase A-like enzyme
LLFGVSLGDVIVVGAIACGLALCVRVALSFNFIRKHRARIALYALACLCGMAALQAKRLSAEGESSARFSQPHIIVLGIDSLRPDAVGQRRGFGVTPNIDHFLEEAIVFQDTTTPLARTFASWMAVLTGQHPVSSGARDNLMPRALLAPTPTLASRLRATGYTTVYATDEVRFSNIDESFGFDRVIGPRMGTSDFLLASWSDSPLANLIVNTRLGRYLFPNTFANRAAAKTYQPAVFVDWLDREIDFDRPTFLAVHLTLPHHPYQWAENNEAVFERATEHPYTYLASVLAADRQFGQLLRVMERKGVLNNAIVVLLSDHGEGLGLPSDNLVVSKEAKAKLGNQLVSMVGHGSSVLSPSQYQVMLAFRGYGASSRGMVVGKRSVEVPASLEDLSPTLLSLLAVDYDATEFDGISHSAVLDGRNADLSQPNRIRFTETGLTTTVMRMGNFGDIDNAKEGMKFYEVEPETSRIVFRRSRMPELLAQKERAAFTRDWLLAAVPEPEEKRLKYILVRRTGGVPEVVTDTPEEVDNPEFLVLYEALRKRFGAELDLAAE